MKPETMFAQLAMVTTVYVGGPTWLRSAIAEIKQQCNITYVQQCLILATWDRLLGALATYKRIIIITGCVNIVSGFITSCSVSYPIPSIIYDKTKYTKFAFYLKLN